MPLGFHGLPEDALDEVLKARDKRLVRPAWRPIWSDQPSGRPKASKFGGSLPYRRPGFVWPRCATCNGQMTFLCQLEVRTLPEEAKQLANLDSGLLQVFFCKCDPFGKFFRGLWVVPEDKSVPSLWCLAASAIKKAGNIPPDVLPAHLEKEARDYNEEYVGEATEETEVAGWQNLCDEVPDQGEWSMSLLQAGLLTDDDYGLEPEELIAEEHRDGIGEVSFPSSGPHSIKLGGWISWGMEFEYPECPDCGVRMTAPLLELRVSAKALMATEEDHSFRKGIHVTLCTRCQRPALGWEWKDMEELGLWG